MTARKARGRGRRRIFGLFGLGRPPRRKPPKNPLARLLRRVWRGFLWAVALFVGGSIAGVVLFRFVDPPVTPLMLIRWVERGSFPAHGPSRPLSRISPHLMRAAMASEDANFCRHRGIDWDQVRVALKEHSEGAKLRGASTITNQVARSVFLVQRGGFVRKGLEWWFTALIEAVWPKRRIMEVYLNTVEWGPGVFGAPAAARHWFRQDVENITPLHAALLITTLPNPQHRRPNRPSAGHARLARIVIARMRQTPIGKTGPCRQARRGK